MIGFFRKGKINTAIEQTYESILPMINIIKMHRGGELPAGFWLDHYLIMFFGFQIGAMFHSITKGDSTREERGQALQSVFEKLSPDDAQQILTKFNILARNPDEDSKRGGDNAANLTGMLMGILKPEFENQPEIIRAKEMAKKLKPDQVAILGINSDYASVGTALLIIYIIEYLDEKFPKKTL